MSTLLIAMCPVAVTSGTWMLLTVVSQADATGRRKGTSTRLTATSLEAVIRGCTGHSGKVLAIGWRAGMLRMLWSLHCSLQDITGACSLPVYAKNILS